MSRRIVVLLSLALLTAAVAAGAGWAGGTLISAEGDDACPAGTPEGSFMGIADPAAPYDLRFIDEMIMHHQGAIMSAQMMIADAEQPELRDLARRIQEGQQRQIDRMQTWRAQWYPDAPAVMDMEPMNGMMGGMMQGMMGGDQAAEMFLRMMIPHHQLAIDMAEDALVNAEHDALKGLAREIITEQSAEIEEMERYLGDWFDATSTRDAADDMGEMMQRMMGGC